MSTLREGLQTEIRCAKAAGLASVVEALEIMAEIDSTIARIEAADRDREAVLAATKSFQKAISHAQQ